MLSLFAYIPLWTDWFKFLIPKEDLTCIIRNIRIKVKYNRAFFIGIKIQDFHFAYFNTLIVFIKAAYKYHLVFGFIVFNSNFKLFAAAAVNCFSVLNTDFTIRIVFTRTAFGIYTYARTNRCD